MSDAAKIGRADVRLGGPGGGGGGGGESNSVMLLSLFLILLAFMLLLNALATFDEKRTRSVLKSVSAAFSASDEEGNVEPNTFEGADLMTERLEKSLSRYLRSLIPLDTFEIERDGAKLTAVLPLSFLFPGGGSTPSPGLTSYARQIATSMKRVVAGQGVELDIIMHAAKARSSAARSSAARARDAGLAARRAAAVVTAFARAGAPRARLSAGYDAGPPDKMRLVFRIVRAAPTISAGPRQAGAPAP